MKFRKWGGGDIKQLLPIFKGVKANDHFLIYIESGHPQLHGDGFGFLISRFLTEISAIFFWKNSENQKFHHVWVHISANIYQIVMKVCKDVEYDPL